MKTWASDNQPPLLAAQGWLIAPELKYGTPPPLLKLGGGFESKLTVNAEDINHAWYTGCNRESVRPAFSHVALLPGGILCVINRL